MNGGWFGRHEDTQVPASIDFGLDAAEQDELVMTCPSCGSQLILEGVQMLGKVMALIGDHIRTHQKQGMPYGWRP